MDKLHPALKFVKGEKNRTGNNECEKNQCVENGYQDAPFAHGSSRLWQSVYHRMTWRGVKGRGRRGSRRVKGFRNWAQKEGGIFSWSVVSPMFASEGERPHAHQASVHGRL